MGRLLFLTLYHFLQVLLGRDKDVADIMNYITGKEQMPLVLVGYPGSGKSALIAYTVKMCLNNKKYKVQCTNLMFTMSNHGRMLKR